MRSLKGCALCGTLALALSLGGCSSKKDISTSDQEPQETSQELQDQSQPPQPDLPPVLTPEPPPPEVRIAALTGTAEYKKANGPWTALSDTVTLDIQDSIRVAPDSSVTILLPDDSKIELGPSTEVFFSENERREISLAYGTLTASMKVKTPDRLGLQVRTLAGLVRGPQASFSVVAPPFGDVLVAVRSGVVYAGDEKKDLNSQADQARAAIAAGPGGQKNPPKTPPPSSYLKLTADQVAVMKRSQPTPTLLEGETPSDELLAKFLKDAEASRETTVPRELPASLKSMEEALSQTEKFLEETNSMKEKNQAFIEALKAARAAKDQAKISTIQGDITRSSRLQMSLKRQAHLLTLEAGLWLRVIEHLNEASAGESAVKAALAKEEAKITALKEQWQKTALKTNGLRPRSRIAPSPGRRPGGGAAVRLPVDRTNLPQKPGVAPGGVKIPTPPAIDENTPGVKGN